MTVSGAFTAYRSSGRPRGRVLHHGYDYIPARRIYFFLEWPKCRSNAFTYISSNNRQRHSVVGETNGTALRWPRRHRCTHRDPAP